MKRRIAVLLIACLIVLCSLCSCDDEGGKEGTKNGDGFMLPSEAVILKNGSITSNITFDWSKNSCYFEKKDAAGDMLPTTYTATYNEAESYLSFYIENDRISVTKNEDGTVSYEYGSTGEGIKFVFDGGRIASQTFYSDTALYEYSEEKNTFTLTSDGEGLIAEFTVGEGRAVAVKNGSEWMSLSYNDLGLITSDGSTEYSYDIDGKRLNSITVTSGDDVTRIEFTYSGELAEYEWQALPLAICTSDRNLMIFAPLIYFYLN